MKSNYTMIPDLLIVEFGLITSAVFGVVWRYEQMSSETCTVSQAKIGKRCGISRSCAIIHLNLLVSSGYLTQETINGIGVVYKTTPKLTYSPNEYEVSSRNIPTYPAGEYKETLLRDSLRDSSWPFLDMLTQCIGLLPSTGDIPKIESMEKSGAIIDDVQSAIAWRKENGKPPVKTIGQLAGGVETSRLKRIQNGNGNYSKSSKRTDIIDYGN
jgi:hypothetical protein